MQFKINATPTNNTLKLLPYLQNFSNSYNHIVPAINNDYLPSCGCETPLLSKSFSSCFERAFFPDFVLTCFRELIHKDKLACQGSFLYLSKPVLPPLEVIHFSGVMYMHFSLDSRCTFKFIVQNDFKYVLTWEVHYWQPLKCTGY